jgi:serine/threonine-protein kinase
MVNGPLGKVADELRPLKLRQGRLILISPDEAIRARVQRPEQAFERLRATHALYGEVRREGTRLAISAKIDDAQQLHRIRDFSASYDSVDLGGLHRALAGMAAAAFHAVPAAPAKKTNPEAKLRYDRGLALVRRSLEGADQAVAEFDAASNLDRNAAYPFAGLAEAYCSKYQLTRDRGWLEKARDALGQAEIREPDIAPVRLAAARLNRLQTLYEPATRDYLRATELEPANPQAFVGLALTYTLERRNLDAIGAFNKAIELKPDYFIAHLELGHLQHRQGRYSEAEKHLRKAVEIDPASSKAHSSLGAVQVDMKRYADAEVALRRSISLERSTAALIDLGVALTLQGNDTEAIRFYEEALASGPATMVLLANFGDSCRRARFPARAQRAYRRGFIVASQELITNPDGNAARAFAAYFNARLGDRMSAEREAGYALRLAAGDAKVKLRTVLTFECLGIREQAVEALRDAPPDLLKEVERHPDLGALRADSRFQQLHALAR